MPCTKCNSDFNLLNWKIRCFECEDYFCSKCLRKVDGDLCCEICEVMVIRPPIRTKLMELKPKDLQLYLNRHNISTHGIVEKQELVELFYKTPIPVRHKKCSRKFATAFSGSVPNLAARSQTYFNTFRNNAEAALNTRNWTSGQSANNSPHRSPDSPPERPHINVFPAYANSSVPSAPPSNESPTTSFNRHNSESSVTEPSPQQPRKFPKLSDFENASELNDLSVKQLKELLTLNRVDYKGCVEKGELLERANRLWNDSNLRKTDVSDNIENLDECCKICMDAPLDCVLLECGHLATCIDCGKKLAECPICRHMRGGGGKSIPGDGILVSIILSESTTSLLNLNIQAIENISETRGSMCIIKPVNKSDVNQKSGKLLSIFKTSDEDEEFSISPEFAYFSESYRCDSDSSVSSLDDIDEEAEMEMEMEMVFLYTRPLVAAKTIAHDNRIYINDNKICVSLLIDDLCLVDSEYICRICHGGESLGDLLAPCKCKGTIALAHMECLEHWLRESANSYCELCQHHYRIIRQPRYNIPWSILMYLLQPGDYWREVLTDIIAFIIYTPSAFISTYMLMLICENIAKTPVQRTRNFSAHMVAFCAVFGMAAIDFTYSSWLIVTFQRQASAWKSWYRNNSFLKIVLPEWRKRPYRWSRAQEASASK